MAAENKVDPDWSAVAEPSSATDVTENSEDVPTDDVTCQKIRLYPVNPPRRLHRRKKKQSKARKIMKRICFRLPKTIFFGGLGIMVFFAIKRLSEITAENKAALEDADMTEPSPVVVENPIEIGNKHNVNGVEPDLGLEILPHNAKLKHDIARPKAHQPKIEIHSDIMSNNQPPHHPPEKLVKIDRKLVEHVLPETYQYHAENGNRQHTGKTFELKPLSRHVAEVVNEALEPEDEATEGHPVLVTGVSRDTFKDVMQLVESVQSFLPKTKIVIFNLDLDTAEKSQLVGACNVEVRDFWLSLYPPHIRDIQSRGWRPLVMQIALAEFHFIIWMDPQVRLVSGQIQQALKMAISHGVSLIASPAEFSTFSVTNPTMYEFLPNLDVARLQKEPHLRINLLVLHSSEKLQEGLMKWLTLCAIEKQCMIPDNASWNCGHIASKHSYANCHKFEESAVNILLKNWFHYKLDRFYIRNLIAVPVTDHYRTAKVKICQRSGSDL